MAPHLHSTLSDEGIEDEDLVDIEPQQRSGHSSRRRTGYRSSPAHIIAQETGWQFQADAALCGFSSAQPRDEQLPETVPIPSQLEEFQITAIETTEGHNLLDFSETCTTARRSSPFGINDAVEDPFGFVSQGSEMTHLSPSVEVETVTILEEQSAEASKAVRVPPKTSSQQRPRKPYNTRSRPKISYADGESSFDEDDNSDVVLSPETASGSRPRNANKKTRPTEANVPTAAKENSLNNKQPEERVAIESHRAAENRKRRQRPKTPLPIDNETQRVPITLPATPPVTEQRLKKRQKRQPQRPVAPKPRSRAKNSEMGNAAGPVTTSPELGSEQPDHMGFDSHNEDAQTQHRGPAPPGAIDQNEGSRDESSIAESAHSTRVTTPSAPPNPEDTPVLQIPAPSCQLPPPPLPLVYDNLRDSVESIPAVRRPSMADLSILMSRNVSRRDEDIGHRLQERIGLHLQDKEKDVSSVASIYRKNGTGIVDRLQRRFAKEHHTLIRRLQEDNEAFNKSLGSAKRGLREGARDRQRVLKELDRNAKRRQQSCSKEIGRIKDIAKRIQSR